MNRYCKNCYVPLPEKAKFCPNCGQKDSDGKTGMGALLKKLWGTTFHIEGKFLRSCWQLFVPGKMSSEFFKGKQGRYPHPLRMFAVVMFIFLFLFNHVLNDKNKNQQSGLHFNQTTETVQGDSTVRRSTPLPPFERLKRKVEYEDMRRRYAALPAALRTPASREAVDSVLQTYITTNNLGAVPGILDSVDTDADSVNIVLFGRHPLHLSFSDMIRYEPEELFRRYNIREWYLQLFLRQSIKSLSNPQALTHAYIGSLTWAILALTALMSGVLMLLYRKQKRYYVEHFIFLLHFHTGAMLALSLVMLAVWTGLFSAPAYGLFFLWVSYAMLAAMRRYYGQGWGKTLLKWSIFGLLYYFCFFVLFLAGLFIVFAIF